MALTSDELELLAKLQRKLESTKFADDRLLRYYEGRQRLEQIGIAIPASLQRFLVVVNWPRVVVDTIDSRQQVRSLILPGEETADPQLQAIYDASNLAAHLKMFNRDRMIYGRAFMSVGTNEAARSLPLIRVESPREMAALVDVRREVATAAARFFGEDETTGVTPTHATLYLPNATIWCEWRGSKWVEIDRDPHNLGAVPVVMHLNRRMSGAWVGESQMSDIIPLTDAAARTMTNLQFNIEAHGMPRKFMLGAQKGDFVDAQGNPIPAWEAYFDAIHVLTNPNAKVGQLDAADVTNFKTALDMYGGQASTVTGFPARYFGLHTANPPAEGAIRADEALLTRSVESQNAEVGTTLGWTAALAMRLATEEWVQGNRIRVDWHDPATPTVAQRMDAVVKAKSQGILSREGAWDELGWSEARKAKERAYFEAEAADPILAGIIDKVSNATGGV